MKDLLRGAFESPHATAWMKKPEEKKDRPPESRFVRLPGGDLRRFFFDAQLGPEKTRKFLSLKTLNQIP